MMGKETIDTNTYGQSKGRNGSYSTNWQISGRELLTPDEVRMLDNRYAILFIRGERPIQDFKYDILKHPNVSLTTDGKGKAFIHGAKDYSLGVFSLLSNGAKNATEITPDNSRYDIYSSEEIEEYLQKIIRNMAVHLLGQGEWN